jgi:chromosome segregation ATPase
VRNLSSKQLRDFLKQRYLDDTTYKALEGVLELYSQIEGHRRRLEEIERERSAMYKQQQQIQGSLAPLGREGDEGALRTRYVATLGGLEDRLAALGAEEQRLNAAIAELETAAKQRLAALSQPAGAGEH